MSWTNEQTGNYTLQPNDSNKLVVMNAPAAATLTLPEPATTPWVGSALVFDVSNTNAGTVTVAPVGSLIDGLSSLALNYMQGVHVTCDGTNYFTVRGVGGGSGMVNPMTAEGDIIVGGASGVPTRLAAGASGYVLTSGGAGVEPSWAAGGGGGSVPTAISSGPDWPPTSPTAYDDEFTGAALNTTLWSHVVNGVPNTIQVGGSLLGIVCGAHSPDNFTVVSQPVPAAPYTIRAKIKMTAFSYNFGYGGMCLVDASGKVISFHIGNTPELIVNYWNSPTSFASEPFGWNMSGMNTAYLSIRDDGTNLYFSVSADGVNSLQIWQASRTAFLSAPAYMGLMAGSNDATHPCALGCDWFRRTA